MREILFRGKSVRTGEWVYGGYHKHIKFTQCPIDTDLAQEDVAHCIIESGFSDWNMPKPIQAREVDTKTIGEYTGVKDCNGEYLYEGDIVELVFDVWFAEENNSKSAIGEIIFEEGAFIVKIKGTDFAPALGNYFTEKITKIGNVHEFQM